MFIYTAKLNKKKAVATLIALAVLISGVVLLVGHFSDAKPSETPQVTLPKEQTTNSTQAPSPDNLQSNDDRVNFLASLGWDVDATPIEEINIVIPTDFTGAYADYNALQTDQGFNLQNYSGQKATRYTYKVLNYPTGEDGIVADIIICNNALIGGDIQSPNVNGFMEGLIH